jgi:hypothetical protein
MSVLAASAESSSTTCVNPDVSALEGLVDSAL